MSVRPVAGARRARPAGAGPPLPASTGPASAVDGTAGGGGAMRLPPSLTRAHVAAVVKHGAPMAWALGALCAPLLLCVLLAMTLLHSPLAVAGAEQLLLWARYALFIALERDVHISTQTAVPRNSDALTPIQTPAAAMLVGYWLPLLVMLVCVRAMLTWTVCRKLPPTTWRRTRVVIAINTAFVVLIIAVMKPMEIHFGGMLQAAQDRAAFPVGSASTASPDGSSFAAGLRLFSTLIWWSVAFSVISIVGCFWVPTSDTALRRAEKDVLDLVQLAHSAIGRARAGEVDNTDATAASQPQAHMSAHFLAHTSYLAIRAGGELVDAGSGRKDDNERGALDSQADAQLSPSPSPAPAPTDLHAQPPLVFLHGYGAGKAFWAFNLAPISMQLRDPKQPGQGPAVYALDLLGMGLSSHTHSMSDLTSSAEAEDYFLRGLDGWMHAMGIRKCVLVGHSFGGYIAAAYALKWPSRVQQLILVSPVGLPVPPPLDATPIAPRGPAWAQKYGVWKLLRWLWSQNVTLSSVLHFLGPLGRVLLPYIAKGRFRHIEGLQGKPLDLLAQYVYHLNAGACPGHKGLNLLLRPGAFAKDPLVPRLKQLQPHIGLAVLYGASDWMDEKAGREVCDALRLREGGHAPNEVVIINHAGHQLAIEQPAACNAAIVRIVRAAQQRALAVAKAASISQ